MPSLVQTSTGASATGSSLSTSFSVACTHANGVVACITFDDALATLTSVTDNAGNPGNTYSKLVDKTNAGALSVAIYYKSSISGNPTQVTVAFSGSVAATIVAAEVTPGAYNNTSNSSAANSGSPETGAISTSVENTLVFIVLRSSGSISAAPSGFTVLQQEASPAKDAEYQAYAAIQTGLNPTWTLASSAPYAAVVGAFGGPPDTPTSKPIALPLSLFLPAWPHVRRPFARVVLPPAPAPIPTGPQTIIPPAFKKPIVLGGPFMRGLPYQRLPGPPDIPQGPNNPTPPVQPPPFLLTWRFINGFDRQQVRPVEVPEDPTTIVTRPKLIPRVPQNISAAHLATSHNNLINLINSLIRSGQLRQTDTKEWIIDP